MVAVGAETFAVVQFLGVMAGPCALFWPLYDAHSRARLIIDGVWWLLGGGDGLVEVTEVGTGVVKAGISAMLNQALLIITSLRG